MSMGPPSPTAPYGAPVDDERVFVHAVLDQTESRVDASGASLRWMGEAWLGTDENRLWLKSEGQLRAHGQVEDGQQEALYDRPVSPFFDVQAGARYDLDSGPGRAWAAVGIQGLAPYRIHVAATAYAGGQGRTAARLEASSDLLLTQKLILSPQIELNLYGRDDPARRIGSGLADLDAGLRLRYAITRKFAPYLGLSEQAAFGETARLIRAAGERTQALRLAVGVRAWF